MDLNTYFKTHGDRGRLAADLRVSPDYLWQIATGWDNRKASPKLALRIESATGGAVSRHDLRPDIFGPAPTQQGEAA